MPKAMTATKKAKPKRVRVMPKGKPDPAFDKWLNGHGPRPCNVVKPVVKPLAKIAKKITNAMIDSAERKNNRDFEMDKTQLYGIDRECVPVNACDNHLIYRALAAYYTEIANDVRGLVEESVNQLMECDISESFTHKRRAEIPVALEFDIWAEIDETKKMPVISLTIGGESWGACPRYRYNPTADKLQRMG